MAASFVPNFAQTLLKKFPGCCWACLKIIALVVRAELLRKYFNILELVKASATFFVGCVGKQNE